MANGERASGVTTLFSAILTIALSGAVAAQEAATPSPRGEVKPAGQPGAQPNPDPNAKPGEQPKPGEEGKKDEKKEPMGPKPVTRPEKPQEPADPKELEVKPDADGRVTFNFKGQPWAGVLEWLANVSNMSLDWQELPGDYLNLKTEGSYTLEEARDLINRHLLARGYTMLQHGEGLTVVNMAKLNPAMVPRVRPEELDDRQTHEVVKVSFPLDWLVAEKVKEELQPMLSPFGKLTPMKTTNRIEVIDAVINLREVYGMLNQEQSHAGQERLVREFRLKHTRAGEVLAQLEGVLGIKKADDEQAPKNPQEMQMAMMMMQQRMQMQQQRGGAAAEPKQEIFLVVNPRENSILAQAPPDKFAIIEQAIKMLDVPSTRPELISNMNRMQTYKLSGLDPDSLVTTLQDVGNLDPGTRLTVDKKNKAIIAYASLADHLTIRSLVEKLDSTYRQMEVIPLRRLEADYVAGTISFMINGDEQKSDNNRRRYYWDYYSDYGGQQEDSSKDKFRVDADVENNRLLLWANDAELKEVHNLLVKLGEIPPRGGNNNTMRIIDTLPPEDVEKVIERLRKIWPSIEPNQLEITPSGAPPQDPAPEAAIEKQKIPATRTSTDPSAATDSPAAKNDVAASDHGSKSTPEVPLKWRNSHFVTAANFLNDVRAASEQSTPSDDVTHDNPLPVQPEAQAAIPLKPEENSAEPKSAPPVSIMVRPDGRMVISSQDTQALDSIEDLLSEIAPPKKSYEIFKLKYISSLSMYYLLKDLFEIDEKSKPNEDNYWRGYFGYPPENQKADSTRRLSRRRPLKLIEDFETNTIIVQNADAAQLRTIREMIDLFDREDPPDMRSARRTQIFRVRYSKASIIADAIKDVYRDLLSETDKALEKYNQNKEQRTGAERSYTYIYGDNGNTDERTQVKFKGLLSIGVDDLSNTLVVSAQDNILNNVSQMIESLDEAARPTSRVEVLQVDGRLDSLMLRKRLFELFGKTAKPPQQQQPQDQQQQNQQNQQQPRGETVQMRF